MFVRILAVTAAVLAAPVAALACPGAQAAGATTASAGGCPHAAAAQAGQECPYAQASQAGQECPYARADGTCDPATCPHAQAITASAAPAAAPQAHDVAPGQVTVAELARALKATPAAVPVDANTEKTRARDGMIPGAKLLTSASAYDPEKELGVPKDTRLVFYCANTRCTASHTAAKRAIEAGYQHVSILPEGIAGWKSAGQKTAPVPRS